MERTLVLIKPDAVRRRLTGEIISRLERKGLTLAAGRLFTMDEKLANEHYAEHSEKPFFGELVAFITSGPLMALAVEGPDAVKVVRTLMGPTDPVEAPPGTIRGDLGIVITENLVHGSDSTTSAAREVELFFPDLH
ncbi:MAG TPA: nucleoside-diphosphate kinase [Actinomycetota bacterium]|nr:nucleoside-diphosphate kinase [Actinomycetota bacterium]